MKYLVADILKAGGYSEGDRKVIEKILQKSKYRDELKWGFTGDLKAVEGDMHINDIIEEIKPFVKTVEEKEKERKAEEERQKRIDKEAAKILVTSGYSFEGYDIVKYSGYISGDDAIDVDRGFGNSGGYMGQQLLSSLSLLRQQALKELKEAAFMLGCNAVIGVDFDYMTLDPQTANATGGTTYYPYVFCVTANGTAVKIIKEGSEEEEEGMSFDERESIIDELPEL